MTAPVATGQDQVVLAARGSAAPTTSISLHWLSPLLVGFASPLLAIAVIDPAGFRHGRLLFLALLVSVLVVAAALFALSLVWPGETTAIVLDTKTRKVAFIRSGVIADSSVEVHFDEIATIGVEQRFDHDGYPYSQAEIRLRDGQRVPLPPGTALETISLARRALGL